MKPCFGPFSGLCAATALAAALGACLTLTACQKQAPAVKSPAPDKVSQPEAKAAANRVKKAAPALPIEPKACKKARQLGLPALSRDDFNRLAMLANSPLFWVQDKNDDCLLDPDELVAAGHGGTSALVKNGTFTPAFDAQYRALVDLRRQEAVRRELNGGRPTVVHTDFTGADATDRDVLKHLLAAAAIIEDLHLHQTGAHAHKKAMAKTDGPSQYLFWRNHGPWCSSPETANDRFCNGLPSFPKKVSEAYPSDIEQDDAMCKMLEKQKNSKKLLNPFTMVRAKGEGYEAVPLTKVFGKEMKAIAEHLQAASEELAAVAPNEDAFRAYLTETAAAFESNSWEEADEKWAAMNAMNSKWYLRVGPDEVYFDPCQQKAGFHMSLARIDQSSVEWQKKLTPIRQTMEEDLARLIGAPYKARQVRFHMPDFIQIVLNAGDSRHPLGATIGQSLPNWGKVAREGRGRTVVMSNLYTDPDSKRISRLKAEALLDEATMAHFTDEAAPFLVNIILHEATHNFGPHSDFKVGGKTPKEIFGGKLASTMEELKAQTGGLWFLQLLLQKKLITEAELKQSYTQAITWCFGHISRGMFTPSGNVRPYSQLAAVQVGRFIEQGALSFADGKFSIHFDKLPGAIDALMKEVGQLKATGNRDGAQSLIDRYVKGEKSGLVQMDTIKSTLLKFPKATFRYSISL